MTLDQQRVTHICKVDGMDVFYNKSTKVINYREPAEQGRGKLVKLGKMNKRQFKEEIMKRKIVRQVLESLRSVAHHEIDIKTIGE